MLKTSYAGPSYHLLGTVKFVMIWYDPGDLQRLICLEVRSLPWRLPLFLTALYLHALVFARLCVRGCVAVSCLLLSIPFRELRGELSPGPLGSFECSLDSVPLIRVSIKTNEQTFVWGYCIPMLNEETKVSFMHIKAIILWSGWP